MPHLSMWKTMSLPAIALAGVLSAAPHAHSRDWASTLLSWLSDCDVTDQVDDHRGSQILLQLEREDLIYERLTAARDEIRALLREARIGYSGLSGSGRAVQVRITDPAEIETAKTALAPLLQPIASDQPDAVPIVLFEAEEPDPGLLRYSLTEAGISHHVDAATLKSMEIIGRRICELDPGAVAIQRQGADRILVGVPDFAGASWLAEILSRAGLLTFQMVDSTMSAEDAIAARPPAGSTVLYSTDDPPMPYLVENRVIVSGENLIDAQATIDQQTGEPVISFRFDSDGTERFGRATEQNVGRLFAIILDDQVISAPQIREPILGGSGQVSGNFTDQSAHDLALLLRSGALPANLTVVDVRVDNQPVANQNAKK